MRSEAVSEHASPRMAVLRKEVAVRIVSAIALAVPTLLLAWSGVGPFAVLAAVVAVILIWEFGRLVRQGGIDLLTVVGAIGLVVSIAVAAAGWPVAGLVALAAAALVSWALGHVRPGFLEAVGIVYIGLPSVALVWLRSDPQHGLEAILFVLLVVWATDSGAYAAGRTLGGPRLWRRVSPNKTWAGLAGGVTASALVGLAVARWIGSPSVAWTVAVAGFLAVVCQLGDLAESAIKRAHGVKNTSDLIPGHGGFMDRVDGLLFSAAAAALIAILANPASPGSALLGFR